MNSEIEISEGFILPLFDEIFVVKERDFSIEYKPLGEGRQKLLMLVSSSSAEYLEESEMQLLNTIIEKGLRKNISDVWIVNIQRFPKADLDHLYAYFSPQQLIVWGCTDWLMKNGLNLEIHRSTYHKGAELLPAAELKSYLSDQQAKARLWQAMQRMFFN